MAEDRDGWLHAGPPWRAPRPGRPRLAPGARVLLSGGTGALGRRLAAHFGARWNADVVALSRASELPRGQFDAVFHLAGSLDDPWGAKREGLLALRARVEAPHWILFSSVAAALPGLAVGIEAYAAANRWLDDFARSTPGVLSLGWAPWRGEGMAAAHADALADRGLRALDPERALSLLDDALACDERYLLVAWRAGTGPGRLVAGGREHAAPSPAYPHPPVSLDQLAGVVGAALGTAPDPDASFVSLGIDSLLALDLVRDLERHLGRELPPTLLFEAPNLRALVAALNAEPMPAPPVQPLGQAGRPATAAAPGGSATGTPLVDSQRTFLVQGRFYPDIPHSVFLAHDVDPPVDPALVAERLSRAAERHEVLRAVVDGDRLVPADTRPALHLGPLVDDDLRLATFNLAQGPLVRVAYDGRRLALAAHHAVLDAWSLTNLAEALLRGEAPSGGPDWAAVVPQVAAPGTAADYAATFADGVPRLPLGRAADPKGPPGVVHTTLALAPLAARARQLEVTLPALVLAAYARRLFQATGQHDVVVRVAHARRPHRVHAVGTILGPFADSLPLRLLADAPLDLVARRAHAALRALPDASSAALAALHRADAPTGLTPAGFSFPLVQAQPGDHQVSRPRAAAANGFTGLGLVAWPLGHELHLSWNFLPSCLDAAEVQAIAEGLFRDEEPPPSLHARVLATAARWPDVPAAPGLSYRQLARRSAALAARIERGTGGLLVGQRVGVFARPGADALVALLAVLRVGAAFVPLDPEWPDARVAQVVHAARLAALVSGEPARFPGIEVGSDEAEAGPEQDGPLAWVSFTSGSTGAPKGVEVSHAAALRWLDWNQAMVGARPGDRVLWTAPLGYGGALRQVFGPLCSGGTALPAPAELRRDPDALLRFLVEEQVTIYNAVPSAWVRLVDAMARSGTVPPRLRVMVVGGEVMTSAHAARWLAVVGPGGPRLVNAYGSTETVVNASWQVVERVPSTPLVPIGRARSGVTVALEPLEGEPTADDVGEIVVRGAVAEGYLGGPRFGGCFRTGDLGRRLPDGTLVYLGRRDSQVKVHGNRVEMGEVEGVLCQHPAVQHAAVRFDGERLHATVEVVGSPGDLRAWLGARLPAYMVPATVAVGTLERTAAGKIAVARPVHTPAPSPAADALAGIWSRVLRLPAPPRDDDDFFALGGDSISLLDVLDAARDAGLGVPSPGALYRARTLRDAAALFGDGVATQSHLSPPAGAASSPALTRAQRGFVLAHRLAPDRPPVWTAALPLAGPVDPDRLREALRGLVRRHPALRVVFAPEPRLVDSTVHLQFDDLSTLPSPDDALSARVQELRGIRLDLGQFPLFAARLCRLGPDRHALLLAAHHALADGWSGWVLAQELLALHEGRDLPPPVLPPPEPEPDARWWDAYLGGYAPGPATTLPPTHQELDVPPLAFTRLLHATFEAVHHVTGQDDLVVSIAWSGRDSRHARAVGALATALPIRARAPFLDVPERLAEALAHAPAAAPPDRLATLGRYFLSWLDARAVAEPEPSAVTVDWAAARYSFNAAATHTEVMVGATPGQDHTRLHVDGGPLARGVAARLHARLAAPDAALVVYAPAGVPVPVEAPTVVETVSCALGRSELVLLPVLADRLEAAGPFLARVPGATRARVVALAGMLPATFGLGARPLWDGDQVATTGHAVTVVAMVMTLVLALERRGLAFAECSVGMLGFGSIGQATLALARARLGEPREVRVRDPRVRLDDLHGVGVVLAAQSGGQVLDVATLAPGTVVIDDSFPRSFDDGVAIERMVKHDDVLLVGGGMVDVGPVQRHSPFAEAEAVRARYGARWLPGCHAEAILVAADPSLGPTVGPVTPARAARAWAAVEAAGWRAAPLHLGPWLAP